MASAIDEPELEAILIEIGAHLGHAAPTRMADAVRARIAARPAPRRGFALLPAAVTAALLLVVLALASPAVRARAQEVFHLPGVQIFRVPAIPTPSAAPSASSSHGELFGGERVTLDDARARAGFRVLVPAALGAPDEVYLAQVPGDARVTLVYLQRDGRPSSAVLGVSIVIVELRGSVAQPLLAKTAGPGTTVTPVTVNGRTGFWLTGAAHEVFYLDPHGQVRQETLRLAANTLLWVDGELTLRLEAQIDLGMALAIASSLE